MRMSMKFRSYDAGHMQIYMHMREWAGCRATFSAILVVAGRTDNCLLVWTASVLSDGAAVRASSPLLCEADKVVQLVLCSDELMRWTFMVWEVLCVYKDSKWREDCGDGR